MERRLIKFIFLSFFLLVGISPIIASVPKSSTKISNLVKKITDQKRKVRKYERELKKIERRLESDNKRYLNTLKRKEELTFKIQSRESEIKGIQKKLVSLEQEAKDIFSLLVLEEMGDEDISTLATKNIFKDIFQKQLVYLNEIKLTQKKLLTRWKGLNRKVNEYTTIEQELLSILDELENQKRSYVQTYIKEKDEKTKLEMKFERERLSFSKNKKQKILRPPKGMNFGLPVASYSKFEIEKKGLTFSTKAGSRVVSPEAGKVIYNGSLSTYGNVIMIDHGKGWRSVILGPLHAVVQKGMRVKKDQILAAVKKKIGFEKDIYFELRNKNKVVETMPLLKELVASDIQPGQVANL